MKSFRTMVYPAQLLALALGLLCLPATSQAAGEIKMTVSATILKHASLQVLSQPTAVVVTAADLARGYVDVPVTSQVAIQSNTSGGYLLEFANQGDFMRQILVHGLGGVVQLSPDGGVIAQSGAPTGVTKATLALGYRFLLSQSAQPGTYAWPMRLSVAPL
ncbi:hypothetical protein [Caenimonas soli]|uniref:hypothetical protein n=1 Tax=Caenimonas soli TaxID=2735555 RepID=UPI0015528A90|nr:hypothetical protein [Caenimonas soli]NPC58062.1 hypothetical protein [Caenimonas soli]